MGRIVTSKYRIEFDSTGRSMTPAVWKYGRPTIAALAKHMDALLASFEPGGVNEAVRYGLTVTEARIVRQDDGTVMATWGAE